MPTDVSPATTAALEQIKQDREVMQGPALKARVNGVLVMLKYPNKIAYANADSMLGKVCEVKKGIVARFAAILDPLNAARTAALRLKGEVIEPVDWAEIKLREGMATWRRDEALEAQRLENDRLAEERWLMAAAHEAERKAQMAKTPQLRSRFTNQAEQLGDKATEAASVPLPQPVMVAGSSTRKVPSWRVKDMKALIDAVSRGEVPEEALRVDTVYIGALFRAQPKAVAEIPGIEIFDDIQIVRNARR